LRTVINDMSQIVTEWPPIPLNSVYMDESDIPAGTVCRITPGNPFTTYFSGIDGQPRWMSFTTMAVAMFTGSEASDNWYGDNAVTLPAISLDHREELFTWKPAMRLRLDTTIQAPDWSEVTWLDWIEIDGEEEAERILRAQRGSVHYGEKYKPGLRTIAVMDNDLNTRHDILKKYRSQLRAQEQIPTHICLYFGSQHPMAIKAMLDSFQHELKELNQAPTHTLKQNERIHWLEEGILTYQGRLSNRGM
jgi:hypothetical protein